jgi:hypothetical protein
MECLCFIIMNSNSLLVETYDKSTKNIFFVLSLFSETVEEIKCYNFLRKICFSSRYFYVIFGLNIDLISTNFS